MENNLNENGLCDETLEMFKEFMAMVNVTSLHPGIDLECGICMDFLFQPHELDVCKHVFCCPCIIRLIQAGVSNCPLCRAVLRRTNRLRDLHSTILQFHEEYYRERIIESGIFNNVVLRVEEDGTVTVLVARRL